MIEQQKDKRYGLIGTILFHSLLFILLLVLGLQSVPNEEEGILINFGDSETGSGSIEPAKASVAQSSVATPPPPSKPATSEPTKEQINTQDFEESAAIESAKEKQKRDLEKKRKVEEEKLKQEELEQQRKEEAERQKRLEAERQRQAELARKAEEARNNVKNAFASGGSNSSSSSSSQGITKGSGNQGALTGDPSSPNYSGSGQGTKGNSFSLNGRSLVGSLPSPEYNIQEEGIVVVEIKVDKYGKVISATPILKGTTTQNSYLWKMATQAALKAKFNSDPNSSAYQKGTITYHFELN